MLKSLGFNALVVNNGLYDDADISSLMSLFSSVGIDNFIFLSNFSLSNDSFSLESSKISRFKVVLKKISSRGIHCKVFYNLNLERGSAFNKNFKRLYTSKKCNSLFADLPLFLDDQYDALATDVNHIIYRRKSLLLISNFDKVIKTSSLDLCQKLLSAANIGVVLDINYIFDPQNMEIIKLLIKNNCYILPSITHHISNYVGIMNENEAFLKTLSSNDYTGFCNCIRKCSDKFIV